MLAFNRKENFPLIAKTQSFIKRLQNKLKLYYLENLILFPGEKVHFV